MPIVVEVVDYQNYLQYFWIRFVAEANMTFIKKNDIKIKCKDPIRVAKINLNLENLKVKKWSEELKEKVLKFLQR